MLPRAKTRDQTIPLGIVGGGPMWDARYRGAVLALTRGRVRAVFSSQLSEAETLAQETGGPLFPSLRQLLEQSGVRALLIMETGWAREWAISLAVARQTPVFVAVPVEGASPAVARSLVDQEAEGAVVVPGVLWRATPATLRLRELLATKLGPIQEIAIRLSATESHGLSAVQAIDWCRSLLSSTVSQMTREATADGPLLVMNCGRRSPLSPPVRTEIRWVGEAAGTDGPPVSELTAKVRCRNGDAELIGETRLRWQAGSESEDELLDGDRPAEAVLLDLFLRRVVGGVVPIPSWAELYEACRLWGE